ncbi:hypothetical protein scyTo_0002202 [Scyliorhinus torazame]|uniref:Uncharacterized protein n=1 Tax=Scyliorhinus torazame TaxID=75743 RepID=A0A401PI82_SCYTO|nr:hypothetical protein [Scyliorhinus torazame]
MQGTRLGSSSGSSSGSTARPLHRNWDPDLLRDRHHRTAIPCFLPVKSSEEPLVNRSQKTSSETLGALDKPCLSEWTTLVGNTANCE